jgi:hypothetical protein
VDGSLCLTHTSHTPRDGLLEAMGGVLIEACSDQRANVALAPCGPGGAPWRDGNGREKLARHREYQASVQDVKSSSAS